MFQNSQHYIKKNQLLVKRKIIGSIFPKKFTFESNQVLTTRINEELIVMLLFYNELHNNARNARKNLFFCILNGIRINANLKSMILYLT